MAVQAPPLFGLVLTGGRSRRFGRDKAGIEVDGQDLLARTVGLLQEVCEQVHVSVRQDQVEDALRGRYRVIADEYEDLGPASGLLSAHAHCPTAAWFVVACDLPMLNAAAVGLLAQVRRADKAATGFVNPAAGFPEPLCAIWEPATLADFRQRVEARQMTSPRAMLAAVEAELIAAPEPRVLENLNTGADFERLGLGPGPGGQ